MIGEKFYHWTVLEKAEKIFGKHTCWKCRCVCGFEKIITASALKDGTTKWCKECYLRSLRKYYSGQRFNHWLVLEKIADPTKRTTRYLAKCDCGNIVNVAIGDLYGEKSTRCFNCYKRDGELNPCYRHGKHDVAEYRIWAGMHKRCKNKNEKCYKWYGGRGIKVCERWDEFKNFYEDMGSRPTPKHEIDRIDNDGDYEPGNCRWVTHKENLQNQRRGNRWNKK